VSLTAGVLLAAACALSLERLCYVFVWHEPERFRAWCDAWSPVAGREPVAALRALFVGFKGIQVGVFLAWCAYFGVVWPVQQTWPVWALGCALVACGQLLNVAVFSRLKTTGVFYGARFGHAVRWQSGFPFSLFRHPQYVGTVLSVWGFFLIMRFPYADWYVIPAIETVYYVLGARFEAD
jgi:methylene-fatty-acyl-phospholipid synthase